MRWIFAVLLLACSAKPSPTVDRLAEMRADVAAHPASKRRFGVVVEPFGAQRPNAVQAFVNARASELRACLPDPELGVIVSWDARTITSIEVSLPGGARSAPAERCLADELAKSRLAQPVSPGRLFLVASAL